VKNLALAFDYYAPVILSIANLQIAVFWEKSISSLPDTGG
jgi:hypothetical protein